MAESAFDQYAAETECVRRRHRRTIPLDPVQHQLVAVIAFLPIALRPNALHDGPGHRDITVRHRQGTVFDGIRCKFVDCQAKGQGAPRVEGDGRPLELKSTPPADAPIATICTCYRLLSGVCSRKPVLQVFNLSPLRGVILAAARRRLGTLPRQCARLSHQLRTNHRYAT
jgi:hypothetical protein